MAQEEIGNISLLGFSMRHWRERKKAIGLDLTSGCVEFKERAISMVVAMISSRDNQINQI